jgi:uncharacterized damage-inducible protein DinB
MSVSPFRDAFDHHVWATLRLIDTCAELPGERLAASTVGVYGSILDTFRHIVAADSSYLYALTGGAVELIDEEDMQLPELRSLTERYGEDWSELLAQDPDPDAVVVRRRDDGSETHAPVSIRLAQAVHHGSDHRSQIRTILTSIGIEAPAIDVWSYALAAGRSEERYPPIA